MVWNIPVFQYQLKGLQSRSSTCPSSGPDLSVVQFLWFHQSYNRVMRCCDLRHTYVYLGSLLHVLFIHGFGFWYPSTEVFPCLSQNTIILLIIENSILKKQPILFMEQAFLLGEVFLKIYNPKDYSFRTSAKKISLNWTSGFTKQSSELRPLTFWSCIDPLCMCTANT